MQRCHWTLVTVGKWCSLALTHVTLSLSLSLSLCLFQGGYDDEDETGSITSERSSFSLSSEVSIMPYATAKYPNPITVSLLF